MIIRPTLACPRKMERTRDWLRRLSGFLLNCSGVPVPPYYTPELKCWRQGGATGSGTADTAWSLEAPPFRCGRALANRFCLNPPAIALPGPVDCGFVVTVITLLAKQPVPPPAVAARILARVPH